MFVCVLGLGSSSVDTMKSTLCAPVCVCVCTLTRVHVTKQIGNHESKKCKETEKKHVRPSTVPLGFVGKVAKSAVPVGMLSSRLVSEGALGVLLPGTWSGQAGVPRLHQEVAVSTSGGSAPATGVAATRPGGSGQKGNPT